MKSFLIAVLLAMSVTATAVAHDGGVTVRITLYDQHPSEVSPFLYLLEIRSSRDATEVVADRRLLTLSIPANRETRQRRVVCRDPDRPNQAEDHRIVVLNAGETWREWIDLRSYCWGRELDALRTGARFDVSYGFPARGQYRWIVDPPGSEEPMVRSLDGEALVLGDIPIPESPDLNADLVVGMSPADVIDNDVLGFRVWVRGNRDRRQRIYIRPDMWLFEVVGPTGRTTCGIPNYHPGPIPDFYKLVSRARRHTMALDGDGFCRDNFHVAGIYHVTPILELTYNGYEHERPSVVGTFRGTPVPVRVRHADGRYYTHPLPD